MNSEKIEQGHIAPEAGANATEDFADGTKAAGAIPDEFQQSEVNESDALMDGDHTLPEDVTDNHNAVGAVPDVGQGSDVANDGELPPDGDCTLPADMLQAVRLQAEVAIPKLAHDAKFTARQICGKTFWTQLTRPEKVRAGQCLAWLVFKKLLRLVFVGRNRSNARMYRRK
jgi:hypothetical protein